MQELIGREINLLRQVSLAFKVTEMDTETKKASVSLMRALNNHLIAQGVSRGKLNRKVSQFVKQRKD